MFIVTEKWSKNVKIGVYLTLVSSKKNMTFFYCKEITTIKNICNACCYLSALDFVSYPTVSIGYSKEKYCRVFAIVMISHHTRKS